MTNEPQGTSPEGEDLAAEESAASEPNDEAQVDTNRAPAGESQSDALSDGSPANGGGQEDEGETPRPGSDATAEPGRETDADAPVTVEGLVESLELVSSERDGYYDSLLRLQAEFENYKKAVAKREADARDRANESLVSDLLPVLDACDGAVANGAEDVAPVRLALGDVLTRHGVERLEPTDAPFDPEQHEAVMHEESDGDEGPVVAEVLRVGYQLKGRTVRAAMVRVRG